MAGNREVITGSDFKRMVTGAYSEFLLEYENINALNAVSKTDSSGVPGTNILRTMGAAVMPLKEMQDDSIGGISRRVADAVILGARGNAGIVLSQLFRGIAKGLSGKYNATSSEFGKAFQYGILYAQRVIPEEPERPIITVAKGVAKGAYHAVRSNLPISEILLAAIEAGEKSLVKAGGKEDAGGRIVTVFLQGCLKGLGGHFVSPMMSFSTGVKMLQTPPNPKEDLVFPYCMRMTVENTKANLADIRKLLQETGRFVVVEREEQRIHIHLHTDHPGKVVEAAVGWGAVKDVEIINTAEPHSMRLRHPALMPVAVVAIAANKEKAQHLQELGAMVIVEGSPNASPSVADLVNAAHSDMAATYVMLSNSYSLRLVLQQAKRILGSRIELVQTTSDAAQEKALQLFDKKISAKANAQRMQTVL